jgi:DNA polymerase-3 subunit alpha
VNNQFIYFKINVKDGWVNRETGKKSEPRITFQDAKLLADVLPTFAKKIAIQLDIYDVHQNLIQKLNEVFQANQGDHQVSFEVVEVEKIIKRVEVVPVKSEQPVDETSLIEAEIDIDDLDVETEMEDDPVMETTPTVIEENRVVTRLQMPCRKLKVKISKELLGELEKLQVNFKLN